jgi:hypothetical protein
MSLCQPKHVRDARGIRRASDHRSPEALATRGRSGPAETTAAVLAGWKALILIGWIAVVCVAYACSMLSALVASV